MRKKLLALFMAAVMLFTYFPRIKAAGSIWFVAVNDSVPMNLTSETEPFVDGGVLYFPYSVFQVKPFGIACSYNESKKESLTLFTRVKRLTFDLIKELTTDKDGNVLATNVIFRNGVLYLPANCLTYFGVEVVMLENTDGYIVLRLTNGSQSYDDDVLLAKAEQLIRDRADRYDNGTLDPETDIPDVQKPDVDKPDDPEEEPEGYAYLAFCGEAVSELSLKLLETEGLRGAFFLTAEQIRQDPALVRMLYAAGNTIGLTISDSVKDVQTALDEANEALDAAIFQKTLLVLLPLEKAAQVQGYRILTMPETGEPDAEAETSDEAAEQPQTQFLVVQETNINNTLSVLLNDKIRILQIHPSSPIA